MDGARFALRLEQVRSVAAAATIVALPKAPPIIEGILDVRGAIVTVLDLRARFRLAPRVPAPDEHLVIGSAGSRDVAFRADRVRGVVEIDPSSIAAPSEAGARVEFLSGIAKLADGLVLIHDLCAFLSAEEAKQLDEARGSLGR